MTNQDSVPELKQRGQSTRLVVLLHSSKLTPESLCHVRDVIEDTWPDADIFIPQLVSSRFSLANPVFIVSNLLNNLDNFWGSRKERDDEKKYEDIVLIGHSLGALLARKLYIYAVGEVKPEKDEASPAPFEENIVKKKREWAGSVSRVILLAGMNRGWRISHNLNLNKVALFTLGSVLGNTLMWLTKKKPLIFYIRRGDPFLTNLRIQWIVMKNNAQARGCGGVMTIQLLGSIDDMVSPEDNIDLTSGRDFYYLDVPKSGHSNVIEMDGSPEGKERKEVFKFALEGKTDELEARSVFPSDNNLVKDEDIKDVVFVIHGIRDPGYWTHKIARAIAKFDKKNKKIFATETSSYGYFPILSFFYPWRRREKVEWLMDKYAESLAKYPNAKFSYVGHSNGTYLLTKALKEYSCCSFKHVVFAGSVVHSKYGWNEYLDNNRVKKILNYVATGDWVVAWFPNFMEWLHLQDLGGAGHKGFNEVHTANKEIKYVVGQHSAALDENNWEAIAKFINNGDIDENIDIPALLLRKKSKGQDRIVKIPAMLIWGLILSSLLGAGWYLKPEFTFAQWQQGFVFTLYIYGIYLALTRL